MVAHRSLPIVVCAAADGHDRRPSFTRFRLVTGLLVAAITVGCSAGSAPVTGDSTSTSPSTECSKTPDATPVAVVAVEAHISAGTTGADAARAGALVETTIAWGLRPANAVTSLDQVATATAAADMTAGQVAVIEQFGLPSDDTVPVSPVVLCQR